VSVFEGNEGCGPTALNLRARGLKVAANFDPRDVDCGLEGEGAAIGTGLNCGTGSVISTVGLLKDRFRSAGP
jgi:hypothetical protein